MKKHQPRRRPNQKARRKPHREVGIFMKGKTLRLVELHSTKGFRESNGEAFRNDIAQAQVAKSSVTLQRGKTVRVMMPVQSNRPKVMHRKTG